MNDAPTSIAASPVPPAMTPPGDGVDDLLALLDTPSTEPAFSGAATEVIPPRPTPIAADTPAAPAETGSSLPLASSGIINDAKALIHTLDDRVYLVSPGVFQRYAQEYPQTARLAKQDNLSDWQWIQKRFEKLQLHRKQDSGLNIWTCEVTGPRKSRRLHGYLLDNPGCLFNELPPNNPHLCLLISQP